MSSLSTNFLAVPRHQNLGTREVMQKTKVIAENLKRLRNERGISQEKLAKAIGVRLNTVQAIERGTTKKSKYLPDIAKALAVNLSAIDPFFEERHFTSAVHKVLPPDASGALDLPLYRFVEAGDGALVMSSDPYKWIERPTSLSHVKDAYAVLVIGESMFPVLRPGYKVQVDPHEVPKRGDYCVFVDNRDGTFKATIKEYVGQTPEAWRVRRYQPKEEVFSLKKRDWPRCDVVVGVMYR